MNNLDTYIIYRPFMDIPQSLSILSRIEIHLCKINSFLLIKDLLIKMNYIDGKILNENDETFNIYYNNGNPPWNLLLDYYYITCQFTVKHYGNHFDYLEYNKLLLILAKINTENNFDVWNENLCKIHRKILLRINYHLYRRYFEDEI